MSGDAVVERPSESPRWLTLAVLIGLGLFFAYDLIEAITNLVGVPAELAPYNEFRVQEGLDPVPVPWSLLVINTALPVVAFAVAVWAGRRRRAGARALILLVALAVVAAYTLTVTALIAG